MDVMLVFTLALLLMQLAPGTGSRERYDGFALYSVTPKTKSQVYVISNLSKEYDIWKHSRVLKQPSDILVPPSKRKSFLNKMNENKISYQVKIKNLQKIIDKEKSYLDYRSDTMDWYHYHNLDEIYSWMDKLCSNYTYVKCICGGRTYEGRQILGITITFGYRLPGVFIESGIHAREWISPAATSWIVNEIIQSPMSSVLRKFNYVYFPVFNPDGYVYSWNRNRLWRKTRKPYRYMEKIVYGADCNRNWDFHWNETGSSKIPTAQNYRGSSPFSEVETKTLSEYIKKIMGAKNIDVYLSYHSYGQLILYPWGHTYNPAPHYRVWQQIGRFGAAALENVFHGKVGVGQTSTTIYKTSGSSVDWVYHNFNVSVALTFEMRDSGRYGFLLPKGEIIPNSEEYFAATGAVLEKYLELLEAKKLPNREYYHKQPW